MNDCQEMIKLWLSLETNHNVTSIGCCATCLLAGLCCIVVDHRDGRQLWKMPSKVMSYRQVRAVKEEREA